MRLTTMVVGLVLLGASASNGQDLGVYITGGTGSIDYLVHRKTIPQFTAGALWNVPGGLVRIGGEAVVMTSNGYVSGRGGPFAEVSVAHTARVRPFVRGGRFFGEDTSWVAGAGIDFWVTGRSGMRLLVQDAFRPSRTSPPFEWQTRHVFHEPSVQVGWVWR
ncbi:MAG: hypothetical protein ACRD1U_19335 [Vicinamibacterales bacterium]